MNLYRFLEPGELIADGDEFCTGIHWRLTVTNPGVPAGDRHIYRRLVAEVPDDANIAAALIAAEIVDAVWDGRGQQSPGRVPEVPKSEKAPAPPPKE